MYDISFEEGKRILHIRMHGFWSMEMIGRFGADAFAAGADIRKRHNGFAILTDARHCSVYSQEVANGFHDLSMRSAAMNPAPNANVAASALAAMQGKRILTPPNYRVFRDHDEAVAWIDAEWVQRNRR